MSEILFLCSNNVKGFYLTADTKKIMDGVYKNTSLDEIPWNVETPPELLVELIESGKIHPCKVVDLGCGAGNYVIYLAGRGYDATGIDISEAAIEIARKNAERKNVKCKFLVKNIVKELGIINQTWDFAYDWGVLHHILPKDRPGYVKNVHKILNSESKYLSVCFSEKDTAFNASGKLKTTSIGSVLYFSSEEELKELFSPYFNIIEMKTVEIQGKFTPHVFNYFFMSRK
jgi:SAM-dependent methyltransferase